MQILMVYASPDFEHYQEWEIKNFCKQHGFDYSFAEDGEDALQLLSMDCYQFDVVVYCTEYSKDTFASTMRSRKLKHPLIIVTSRSDSDFYANQLNDGADHVQVVPTDDRIFGASIRAVVRRSQGHCSEIITIGNLTIDLARRLTFVNGKCVYIAGKQWQILEMLIRADGKVVSKSSLLDYIYSDRIDSAPIVKIIDVWVCRMRKVLGKDLIKTVHCQGFRIEQEE